MIKYFSVSIAFSLSVLIVAAQQTKPEFPFIIRLEQMEINNMPALQSFAYATWQGKWLMIGGRKDGLHRRQPWATFDEEGQNRFIYVVDPQNKKVWKQMLENLPTTVIEQLQSTNMGFCQTGNRLFLTGC